jgi:4-oxalocrotonate tautomerase
MPHVNIKHFPAPLDERRAAALVAALTSAVQEAFGCPAGVISIALEAVDKDAWAGTVYDPEIRGRAALLVKRPEY